MNPVKARWPSIKHWVRFHVWWRIRYGKHIGPGTWSRGSDYGRDLWAQMKADRRKP